MYMTTEQLPKEIASKKKMAQDLQRVVAEPAMGQSDLDAINAKVNFFHCNKLLVFY